VVTAAPATVVGDDSGDLRRRQIRRRVADGRDGHVRVLAVDWLFRERRRSSDGELRTTANSGDLPATTYGVSCGFEAE
jgi:hypothetical protein